MQKRLMLLGGLSYLIPVISEAHKLGVYVITADYLPDNIAHKYSDEYCNVSIIDKEEVLKAARRLKIDGIMSFAVDPGVVSAAYVAERLGLPFQCSYDTACVLQNKFLFRSFLKKQGFNCPVSKCYRSVDEAIKDADTIVFPSIVKPVDSAGSKGVAKVNNVYELRSAIENAINYSLSKRVIVEEFIEKSGRSIDAEIFIKDGEIKYFGFFDQYFDLKSSNHYVPATYAYPTEMGEVYQQKFICDLTKLSKIIGLNTGLYNVEWRIDKSGNVYLMEVSPRGGGNRLSEFFDKIEDANLIELEICKSLNLPLKEKAVKVSQKHYGIVILRSPMKEGIFQQVAVNEAMSQKIIETELRVKKGCRIKSFDAANAALGTLFLQFDNRKELDYALQNQEEWVEVVIC